MQGQLLIDLGFRLAVRADATLGHIIAERDGYRFEIFAPYKSQITPRDRDFTEGVPLADVADRLIPADPQPTPVTLDGGPAIVADTLHVRILGPLDNSETTAEDPAVPIAFAVVNGWLERVRLLSQVWRVRPVAPSTSLWSLTYLDDDGDVLQPEGGFVRMRGSLLFDIPAMPPLTSDGLWNAAAEIPISYVVPPWESLLMDAFGLLPEAGPALVLGAASIETRIDAALEQHADQRGGSTRALWSWLSQRGQHWRRLPSRSGFRTC